MVIEPEMCNQKKRLKSKKHNQLYFGTLVLALYFYCGDNT